MRLKTIYVATLALMVVSWHTPFVNAQTNPKAIPIYPQQYFRNPLDIPIVLAGNFGECRPNHFHSGIDIKTAGKENLPVYAAAEGYVSRIKIEKGGFGHALYVTHPNGFTTLYAHLNDFVPAIQAHLRTQQYKQESWAVDLALAPGQFPVRKGQQIAWSGNTGASTAPHLHFEIRDSQTEHPLNPQLFGLDIKDKKPPQPLRLALYDLRLSVLQQKPDIKRLIQLRNGYTWQDTLVAAGGDVAVSIEVNDFMEGSDNTLTFYTMNWFLDDSLLGTITLDNIGYDETRFLHAYVDYHLWKEQGNWFQCLYQLPGNQLNHLYTNLQNRGGIRLTDDKPHTLRIELEDATGNKTVVKGWIKQVFKPIQRSSCDNRFSSETDNSFTQPNIRFVLPKGALYEPLCFRMAERIQPSAYTKAYSLHDASIPIHHYFSLALKPEMPVPFAMRDKIVMVYSDGKKASAKAATPEDGWYRASVRQFGDYWLESDTVPPVIKPLQPENAVLKQVKSIGFAVTESKTSVKSFRAVLDGKWLLFEPTGNTWRYFFDEHCPPGKHELRIEVADENNNISSLVYRFVK